MKHCIVIILLVALFMFIFGILVGIVIESNLEPLSSYHKLERYELQNELNGIKLQNDRLRLENNNLEEWVQIHNIVNITGAKVFKLPQEETEYRNFIHSINCTIVKYLQCGQEYAVVRN